jgi:hypothetical protein
VAENVDVDLVAEVVGGDAAKEVRPLVVELEVVDFRIVCE